MNNVTWFKDAIIYHILIDRFAGFKSIEGWNKPVFLGGNLRGITDKISYLKELGVNTIWISPFYETSEYHGYHITDFYKVDPHFGTENDLKHLIETVHSNNMKIIADFVPNHCSNQHPFFIDAQQNKESRYKNWFYFTNWPKEYLCFLSVDLLPKINLEYQPARKYIIDAAKHWLSFGLDGYRLDHVIGPSHYFWKEFKSKIKSRYPNVVLIGEAWMMGIKFEELATINIKHKVLKWIFGASSDRLLKEYLGELDGVLDFKFQEIIREYVRGKYSEKELYKKIKKHYKRYPDCYFLPTFLDNHDMDRILFECKGDIEKLKEIATIQFSINQPAIIYYGTEAGMHQEKSIWNFKEHGDLQARQPMNWKQPDKELIEFYKQLIKLKKESDKL